MTESDSQDARMATTIAERVAALRAARRISQAALAKEVGVSQPTIANIERGRTIEIKGYVLEALAHALNTTPQYVLQGGVAQEAIGDAATQAELVGIWQKLPQQHKDTLLQTARGLLRAAEISPPTASAPRTAQRAKAAKSLA
jgi:transcriptional regulator with XRE-family HTH domain